MMMTPLAPRRPYRAVSAGSFRIWIEAMSLGLTPVRYPLGPGSITTPSSTYNGVFPLLMDEPPRMRTAKPPSGPRVTSTPGKRPISTCSIDCPGAVALSPAVTIALGGEVAGAGCAPAVGPFRWAQAEPSPRNRLHGSTARSEDVVSGVRRGHPAAQHTT